MNWNCAQCAVLVSEPLGTSDFYARVSLNYPIREAPVQTAENTKRDSATNKCDQILGVTIIRFIRFTKKYKELAAYKRSSF